MNRPDFGPSPTWDADTAPPPAPYPPASRTDHPGGITGGASLRTFLVGIALFFGPLGVLTAIGHQAGPLVDPYPKGETMTVDGENHQIVLTAPMDCEERKEDLSVRALTCVDGPRTYTITTRVHQEIADVDLAARRNVRMATLNRAALEAHAQAVTLTGAKASRASGEGLIGNPAHAIAIQPDGEAAGFTVSIDELINIPFDADPDDPAFTSNLDMIADQVIATLSVEPLPSKDTQDTQDTEETQETEGSQ